MISPTSLSAFSVPGPVAPQAAQAAANVRLARVQQSVTQAPATTTQQLQANPPQHPGRVVPRGSLLDLKV
jgi:hypothetical protein